jgi:hypothetical protein
MSLRESAQDSASSAASSALTGRTGGGSEAGRSNKEPSTPRRRIRVRWLTERRMVSQRDPGKLGLVDVDLAAPVPEVAELTRSRLLLPGSV